MVVDGRPLGYKQLESAPLKGRARAREKINDDYHGHARRLCDCVRCSVIVNTEAQLIAVAQALDDSELRRQLRKQPPPRLVRDVD